jgi:uncharacterized protein
LSAAAVKPLALSLRRSRDGVIVPVRLTPKSSRDEVAGVEDRGGECVLKARVRAVPEAGRANDALETLIAKWLGVPPSTVTVAHGVQVAAEAGRGRGRWRRARPLDRAACC